MRNDYEEKNADTLQRGIESFRWLGTWTKTKWEKVETVKSSQYGSIQLWECFFPRASTLEILLWEFI